MPPMSSAVSQTETLWQKAVEALDSSSKANLDLARTAKRDVVAAVLRVAEAKHQLSFQRRWRIKRPGGDDIIIRDVVEKIISWIRRFRDVGDVAVQYSPDYASLPWAAVRFLLQVAINETEVFGGIVDDLEMVARLLARFREFEHLHLANSTSLVNFQIRDALIRLYTRVLQHLSKAISFFQESSVTRALKATFRSIDEQSRQQICDWETEILKLAGVADTERLISIEMEIKRLSVLHLDSKKLMDEADYLNMLEWLSSVPFSSHHRDHSLTRISGTGEWLPQHPQYRGWMASSSCSILLLHGIPGCGKTSLFSAEVDRYLHDLSTIHDVAPLAYFYCSASESEPERRHSLGVMRSLTRQLTVTKPSTRSVHNAVSSVYERKKEISREEGFRIARPIVAECVEIILEVLETNPVTIAVDAIDELDEPTEILDALSEIQARSKNIVKILLTSRDDSRISALLTSATTLRITDRHNSRDLEEFTRQAVEAAVKDHRLLLGNLKSELKEQLIKALISGAGEMFLWVKLQLARLCQMRHEADISDALPRLASLSTNELYQKTYDHVLNAGESAKQIAVRTFSWLLYACDPLSSEVFHSLLSTSAGGQEFQIDSIVHICHNLIYLDTQLDVIRFAHQSVQEFLQLQPILTPSLAQQMIASSCISVCCDGPAEEIITKLEPTRRKYDYAALYWGHHCSAVEISGERHLLWSDLENFLFDTDQDDLGIFATIWLETIKNTRDSLATDHPQRMIMETVVSANPSPLLPICAFGIPSLLHRHPWSEDFNWDQRNDAGQTALYIASYFGHHPIVSYLISKGADVNITCGEYGSPLHCAAFRGHTEVAAALMSSGADPAIGDHFETAIHAACLGGKAETALVLLDAGFKIHDQKAYESILQAAAEAGFTRMIEELHKHPFSNLITSNGKVALCVQAIAGGKLTGLKALLRSQQLASLLPEHAVAISAQHGHIEMTTFLLDKGYDIEKPGDLGTPLRCASLMGHRALCRLLLDRGADVQHNSSFGTALHAAAMKGHTNTARLLLGSGADVDAYGGFYGTPIQAAAHQGHAKTVQFLLDSDADMHRPGICQNALLAAVHGGKVNVLKLFLETGHIPPVPIVEAVQSLHSSPGPERKKGKKGKKNKKKQRIQQLCQVFQVEYSDDSQHPLLIATARGHSEVIALLLEHEGRFRIDQQLIKRAICAAAEYDRLEIYHVLRTHLDGSDNDWLSQALHNAALHGNVQMLSAISDFLSSTSWTRGHLCDILESGSDSPSTFQTVLHCMEDKIDRADLMRALSDCLKGCAQSNHLEIIQVAIECYPDVAQEALAQIFDIACCNSNYSVARYTYEKICRADIVSSKKALIYARAALLDCSVEFFEWLLKFVDRDDVQPYLSAMTLWAAGNGLTSVLKLLTEYHTMQSLSSVMNQALNVAAENGHVENCRLLLENSADPWIRVDRIAIRDCSLLWSGDWFITCGKDSYDIQALLKHGRLASGTDLQENHPDSPGHVMHALASCLESFKRSEHLEDSARLDTTSWRKPDNLEPKLDTLKLILDHGEQDSEFDKDAGLYSAVTFAPAQAISLLITHGASMHSSFFDASVLDIALAGQAPNFAAVKALLEAGAADGKETQYLLAICHRFFSPFMANVYTVDNDGGCTSSLRPHFQMGVGSLILHLLQHIPDESLKSINAEPIIPIAVAIESKDLVQRLLNSGMDINATHEILGTGLHVASYCGNMDLVHYLIDADADPNASGGRHDTPISAAILKSHREVVLTLVDRGANIGPPWTSNTARLTVDIDELEIRKSPVQLALDRDELEIARLLCGRGADLQHDESNAPFLAQACTKPDVPLDLIESIFDAGARQSILYYDDDEPSMMVNVFHGVIRRKHTTLVDLFLTRGVKVASASLRLAVEVGYPPVLERLLRAVPNAMVKHDLSELLKIAIRSDNTDTLGKLLAFGITGLDYRSTSEIVLCAYSESSRDTFEMVLEHASRHSDLNAIGLELLDLRVRGRRRKNYRRLLEYIEDRSDRKTL